MVKVCLVQRGKEESETFKMMERKNRAFHKLSCSLPVSCVFFFLRSIVMFTASPISLVLFIVIYSNSNSYSNLALLQQLFPPYLWIQY